MEDGLPKFTFLFADFVWIEEVSTKLVSLIQVDVVVYAPIISTWCISFRFKLDRREWESGKSKKKTLFAFPNPIKEGEQNIN